MRVAASVFALLAAVLFGTAAVAQQAVALRGVLVLAMDAPAAASAAPRCDAGPAPPARSAPQAAAAASNTLRDFSGERARLVASGPIASTLPRGVWDAADARTTLAPFLGQPITSELTAAITQAVARRLAERGRYLVDVFFPPEANQDVRDGVLALVVGVARLGRIASVGQVHQRAEDIVCRIRLVPGAPIDLQRLDRDIERLNAASSFRRTDPVPEFRPGAAPGETDLVLSTRDVAPWRVFANADNTGTRATGLARARLGFTLGSAFGRFDHQLDYTFTSAGRTRELSGHALAYAMPITLDDRLALRLDTSRIDVELQDGLFRSRGDNLSAGIEWSHALQRAERSTAARELFAGLEWKRIGNSLAFNQEPVSDTAPRVVQAYFGARAAWADGGGGNQLGGRLTLSPGNIGPDNDDRAYDAVRSGARARHWRANLNFDRTMPLPAQWSLHLRASAQLADAPLIASERFGLSGVGGVRGYYQDTLIADAGVAGGLELQTPAWTLREGATATVQWLVFADAGRSWNATAETNADLGGTARRFDLSAVGAGTRIALGPAVYLRLDVARRSNGLAGERSLLWHGFAQLTF